MFHVSKLQFFLSRFSQQASELLLIICEIYDRFYLYFGFPRLPLFHEYDRRTLNDDSV